MILEAVTLYVKPGIETEFEAAFKQASALTALLGFMAYSETSRVHARRRFLGFHCTP